MMVMESLAPSRLLRSLRGEADDGDCPEAPRTLEAPRALAEADARDVLCAAAPLDVEAAWGSEAEGALQPIIPPIAKAATPAKVSLLRVEPLRVELFFIACPSRFASYIHCPRSILGCPRHSSLFAVGNPMSAVTRACGRCVRRANWLWNSTENRYRMAELQQRRVQ